MQIFEVYFGCVVWIFRKISFSVDLRIRARFRALEFEFPAHAALVHVEKQKNVK
jgi:hypothetical protein